MSFARTFALAGCLAAVMFNGCYRSADKAENKPASGTAATGTAASGTAAKSSPFVPVVVEGTDIPDDRDSKALQMVTVAQIREDDRKRAETAAAAEAAVARHQNPAAQSTASPTGTATPTGTSIAAASPKPTASPTASPSATSPAVATGTKPAVAFDPYVRPAMQRDPSLVAVEVRPSRSPKPKQAPPVDRTKVLAAPATTGGTLGITFDNLMFDIKPTDVFSPTMFNDAVRDLFGKKVKLRGYIHPGSAMVEKGLTQFVFVRDDQACCFGPGALLYDNVVVKMKPGKTANFSIRPIAVEGVLSYQESGKVGTQPASIFQIDATSAE